MTSVKASAYKSQAGFDFDAFTLKTKEHTVDLLMALCKSTGVDQYIKKTDKELSYFFKEVAARMHANPYHNLRHITDVTQFCCTVLVKTKLLEWLPPLSIVAMFFSAVCHDLEHPGCSNVLVINEAMPIAKKYPHCDCPLEHYHVEWCKQLIAKHKILSNLPPKESAELMKSIEELILSTDMKKHTKILETVKAKLTTAETDCKSATGPLCQDLLKLLIKSSDISNQARPIEIAWKWNITVYTEFYREGDMDRKRGRKVNPLHDRHTNVIAKSTVGFINFVVRPLLTVLQKAVQTLQRGGAPLQPASLAPLLANLDANVAANSERAKSAEPGLPKV